MEKKTEQEKFEEFRSMREKEMFHKTVEELRQSLAYLRGLIVYPKQEEKRSSGVTVDLNKNQREAYVRGWLDAERLADAKLIHYLTVTVEEKEENDERH